MSPLPKKCYMCETRMTIMDAMAAAKDLERRGLEDDAFAEACPAHCKPSQDETVDIPGMERALVICPACIEKIKTEARSEWVVCDATKGGAFVCKRCKAEYKPNLPVDLGVFVAMGNAFVEQHRKCEAR